MLRNSLYLCSKVKNEGSCLISRMALGYDPKNPPKYVESYWQGVALQEEGKLKQAFDKYMEALSSEQCVDRTHRAAICFSAREIQAITMDNGAKEHKKAYYSTVCAVIGVVWGVFLTFSRLSPKKQLPPSIL